MIRILSVVLSFMLFSLGAAHAAGDPVAGKRKAAACVSCHGNKHFSGFFFTLQLAGRDPDKLTIKTNKYRSYKIFNPMMNFVVAGLSDQDVERYLCLLPFAGEAGLRASLPPDQG